MRRIDPGSGLEAVGLEGQMRTGAAMQTFGTRQRSDELTHTKKGIKNATSTAGATGQAPPGAAGLQPNVTSSVQGTRMPGLAGSFAGALSTIINPR